MKTRPLLFSLLLLLGSWILTACHKEEAEIYQSIEDLRGKKVAVCVGSIHDHYLSTHYPDIHLLYMTAGEDMMLPIRNGQAHAGMLPILPAQQALRAHPDLGFLGTGYMYSEVGFPFAQRELRDRFNQYLNRLRTEGKLEQMVEKWVTGMEKAPMPQFRFSDQNGTLRIGICPCIPLVFLRDGEVCGLETELLYGFCQEEKLMPKLLTYNFSAILAAITMGQIDVISAAVAITQERKATMLFSDPYHQFPAALITHKKHLAQTDSLGTEALVRPPLLTRLGHSLQNNLVTEKRYLIFLRGLKTTLILSLLSLLIGTLTGALLCILRMSRLPLLRGLAQVYIGLLRGIPPVVFLMLMYYGILVSSKLGEVNIAALSFGLYFAAFAAEIFRTCLEGLDPGQREAGLSLGFTKPQIFRYILFPQVIRPIFPLYKGEMVSLVKMTAIVGYIAVEDLTKAADLIRTHTYEALFPLLLTALLYFLLIFLLTRLLRLLFCNRRPDHGIGSL